MSRYVSPTWMTIKYVFYSSVMAYIAVTLGDLAKGDSHYDRCVVGLSFTWATNFNLLILALYQLLYFFRFSGSFANHSKSQRVIKIFLMIVCSIVMVGSIYFIIMSQISYDC